MKRHSNGAVTRLHLLVLGHTAEAVLGALTSAMTLTPSAILSIHIGEVELWVNAFPRALVGVK